MKSAFNLLFAACLLFPWCSLQLSAQQNAPVPSGKKIIITKRSVEADGTEVTETMIKKGEAAENFDVDKYVRENRSDQVELNIRIEDRNNTSDNTYGEAVDTEAWADNTDNWSEWSDKWSEQWDKQSERWDEQSGQWNQNNDFWSSDDENRAFLGIEEDSDEDADQPGIVVQVVRGSAAALAGLKTNDVLLKLNDQAINQWKDVTAFMRTAKPGDKVRITYQRKDKAATAEATLTEHSDVESEAYKHGFLGISASDNDTKNQQDAVKVDVTANSAAAKAGLLDGDELLKLNEEPIRDFEDVTDFMADTKVGDQVQITYRRAGKTATATATLGESRDWNESAANWESLDQENWSGMEVQTKQKEACLGVYTQAYTSEPNNPGTGALVTGFTTASAAQEAQLQEMDVITSINGQAVKGHPELWNEIAKYKAGDHVQVGYLRQGETHTVETTLKTCRDDASQVTLEGTGRDGDRRSRRFTTWNWDRDDQTQLRRTRLITIHKGGEGDAVKVEVPAANQPAERKLPLQSFRAFPNPSLGQVTVEFRGAAVATIVSLLDLNGRQLFREEMNMFDGTYNQQFDLSEYAKGTITILVQQGDKSFAEQLSVN